ncbi:BREX system ATP-binding domain-containing protein [Lentzea sp.]|uniref:BREX system ATP-binding domain-containing protein n=1 Tax=Lentzea sp. TaxID=56099 RepID=UPI002CE786F8|nr:BREX system ATP-binding domain-containing protein [Lentzea sp.]HUQ55218.1 BREX system ATP-binding domain-containing protein [Lentzea sp.]
MSFDIESTPLGVRLPFARSTVDSLDLPAPPDLSGLEQRLDFVAQGHDAVLFVEGGAGTGKTTLLRAVAGLAERRGFVVFSTSASRYESSQELNLVRRLCGRPEEFTYDQEDLQTVCRDVHRSVLAAASHSPVLLMIDDLHWCDLSSLHCLAFLSRRTTGRPVAILCSKLSGSNGPDPVLLEETLRSHSSTSRVRLGPLTEAAVRDLVTRALGRVPTELSAALAWWCGRNPFLVGEVLEALTWYQGLPVSVTDVVPPSIYPWLLGRLPHAVPACLPVAQAVAVLGDHARLALISEVAGVSSIDAAHAVTAMTDLGLLRAGETVAFQHPVVGAAVRNAIPPIELPLLQLVAAEQLQRSGASLYDMVSFLLASDAVESPFTTRLLIDVVRHLRDTATAAAQLTVLRQLLVRQLPDEARVEVVHQLGHAELDLAPNQAVEHLAEAHRLTVDVRQRAAVAIERAQALHSLGRAEEAVALLEDAASATSSDETLRARIELQLVTTAIDDPGLHTAALRATRRLRMSRHTESAERIAATLTGATACDVEPGEAWRLLAPTGSPGLPLAWLMTARAVLATGQHHRILPYTTEWVSAKRQSPVQEVLALSLRAEVLLRLGNATDAAADANAALKVLDTLDGEVRQAPLQAALGPLVDTLLERGELDSASRLLADAQLDADLPPRWHRVTLLLGRGRLRQALGDPVGGLSDVLRCGDLLSSWGDHGPYAVPWRVHAVRALLALGDRDTARELAEEELAEARGQGCRAHRLGVALCSMGQTAGGNAGLDLLMESINVLEGSDAQLDLAVALGELGRALSRAGRARDARHRLKQACALADEAGATVLSNVLESRLREAGGRARGRVHGVGSLTATERQVARLAVTGRTNKEIASTLFVTRRTVEMHLTQVYRKLRITGRSELSDVLGLDS